MNWPLPWRWLPLTFLTCTNNTLSKKSGHLDSAVSIQALLGAAEPVVFITKCPTPFNSFGGAEIT